MVSLRLNRMASWILSRKTKRILMLILLLNVFLLLANMCVFYLIYDPNSDRSWMSKYFGFLVEPKEVPNVENSHRLTKSYLELSRNDKNSLLDFLKRKLFSPKICDDIFMNDKKSVERAREKMKRMPRKFMKDGDFAFIIDKIGCDKFKQTLKYNIRPLSAEEENFPLAFGIVMYRDVEQFERLLRAIYSPQNYYCVHVDLKSSSAIHSSVEAIASCFDNVFIPFNLADVKWGHFSALKAHLICAEQLLKFKKWKYFINLSGQEFPLLSNRQIVRILEIFNGTNEIQGGLAQLSWDIDRWKYKWIFGRRGFTRTDEKKSDPPHNLSILKASVYIVASRDFLDFCSNNKSAREYLSWLEDTFIPDESFFATLNHDKGLCAPGGYYGDSSWKPYIARFTNWNEHCNGKKVRTVCVLGVGDIGPLVQDNRKMFANKLFHDYEYLALDCLEEHHRRLTSQSSSPDFKFDDYYYKNLPQVMCKECKNCV